MGFTPELIDTDVGKRQFDPRLWTGPDPNEGSGPVPAFFLVTARTEKHENQRFLPAPKPCDVRS
jgi:hypothetical protein